MSYDSSKFKQKLDQVLEHIKRDLASLRTGKASTALLDPVLVEAYGSKMKINELANVSAPDLNMLVVVPWDKTLLATIEKAIAASELNIHPVVSGDQIRIIIPSLTEERRLEMVKMLGQKIENGRVMIRNVRSEVKKDIDDQKGQAGVSEDDIAHDLEALDKTVQEYLHQLDDIAALKEQELMKI